jgi:hydrogenase maturation protein HypF
MRERLRVAIRGAVQGVGFRPFVYRLAADLGLDGWVQNSTRGVTVEVEGDHDRLERCLGSLRVDVPARAVIQSLEASWLDPVPYAGFRIRDSEDDGTADAFVLPDIAMCADCRREIGDPANRRYRYPFTNCTNCGPRYSILHALPYDRAQTSMREFRMCPACQGEYDEPSDRRFHAQPNACPVCGPHLELWDGGGRVIGARDAAMKAAAAAIGAGQVVAVKGLGGFHLVVDARHEAAVGTLRVRKHREAKPFAVMFPGIHDVSQICEVGTDEAALLQSPESPIVLLTARAGTAGMVAPGVAPGNPLLGVMLPYTPLHHLLLAEVGGPVVATSGNLSDEPICTDEREALERLGAVADFFLVHDRPIVRPVDDSIVRLLLGRELVMRRARGYAPLPVQLPVDGPPIVGVGAHLKSAVAVACGREAFISQHIGDLESQKSTEAFVAVLENIEGLFRVVPEAVAADLHPDYVSTRYARAMGLPMTHVQHHAAHVAACMADNDLRGTVLGVSWDGTGLGTDGTVWGGEFLVSDGETFRRAACLRPFQLPGGEAAVREPRRSALGVLTAMAGDGVVRSNPLESAFEPGERRVLEQAMIRGVNAPVTTSAGRLFDAAAALTGLCLRSTFEGQAAMALEHAAIGVEDSLAYPFAVRDAVEPFRPSPAWEAPALVVDWAPTFRAMLADIDAGLAPGPVSARFHAALAEAIVAVAVRVGEPRVALTGGCFQNRLLLELAVAGLTRAGLKPYWHQRVPANDGGIALGQLVVARRQMAAAPGRKAYVAVLR